MSVKSRRDFTDLPGSHGCTEDLFLSRPRVYTSSIGYTGWNPPGIGSGIITREKTGNFPGYRLNLFWEAFPKSYTDYRLQIPDAIRIEYGTRMDML